MRKILLFTAMLLCSGAIFAQDYWSLHTDARRIITDKAITRLSFPGEFKLFDLNKAPLQNELFKVVSNTSRHSTIISLPNADGQIEQFEVVEASNFEPALQRQFPEIRAFSGKGITDKSATLKLSLSPQGIQTMVFRTDKENEFIEPYARDHTVYAVFRSRRKPGTLPWTCSTPDQQLATDLGTQVGNSAARSTGDLKTMRLAQSVTAEYSNYFGATSAAQVNLVLAAINATLTRCNGVYEKDLAVHLDLIAASTNVIYYNAATDPYDNAGTGAGGTWNGQLQTTLTNIIGEANYDIGHLFGASGGGGNAGCIGCVCTDGTKGRGFTSPADNIPQGDNFDIDYVVHEVGHQLGANHTFSFSNESTGVNKEVGSGITIMGYAGITSQDVAAHSIDIYHEASIAQIQARLNVVTCPVTTVITNSTPVVNAVINRTIPISTPFALTGSATDANAGDVLTYCWEQDDNAGGSQTGNNSLASITKASGPNWISFAPTTSPVRYFPRLASILAGSNTTGPLTGGDAGVLTEALSSVSRTLNFRLTVRDNAVYSSTTPVSVGQTQFTDMVVTVSNTSGPFSVTAPNTAVSWAGNSSQTITWAVANTTAAPVSCANVKISISTDGGNNFSTLVASTVNDGSEVVTIPNTPSTTARVKIEAVGNIFFDISNTNFTITAPVPTLTVGSLGTSFCSGASVNIPYTSTGVVFSSGNVFTAQLSSPTGSFASPVNIGTLTSTATSGNISATIPVNTLTSPIYRIRIVSSNPSITGANNGTNLTITGDDTWSADVWTSIDQSVVVQLYPATNGICQNTWVWLSNGATSASQYILENGSNIPNTYYFDGYSMTFEMPTGTAATFSYSTTINGCNKKFYFNFQAIQCNYNRIAANLDSSKFRLKINKGKDNDNFAQNETTSPSNISDNEKYTYKAFPNPAKSELIIYADGHLENQMKNSSDQLIQMISISDMSGKQLLQRSYSLNTTKANLDISRLYPGMYVARIYDGKKWTSIKFIKE